MQRHIPFGYCIKNGMIEKDERAEIVLRLFLDYLAGASINALAKQLSREKVPTASNCTNWTHSSVSKILQNERYMGDQIFPAIVSQELFQMVEERRIAINEKRGGTGKTRVIIYPFNRKIQCGECGTYYSRNKRSGRYLCQCRAQMNHYNGICPQIPLTEVQLKNSFHQLLQRLMREHRLYEKHTPMQNLNQSEELHEIQMQIKMLKESNADPERILQLLYRRTSEQYRLLKAADTAELTVHVDTAVKRALADGNKEFDDEIFQEVVSKILVYKDKRLVFQLTNGVEIEQTLCEGG